MRSKTAGLIMTLALILSGGMLFAQEAQEAADTKKYPFDLEVRGRLHFDGGVYLEDATPLDNGFNVRRARLGAKGKLAPGWDFVLEYDFAENGTSANDVMLSGEVGPGKIKFGHFKVPMGLNELTSSNNITFMERASNSNTIVDSRKLGIGYDFHSGMFGVQTMVFGRGMGENSGSGWGEMPIGAAGRFYISPLSGNMVLHVGGSGAYVRYSEDSDATTYSTLRFRDRPEARADRNTRLIDTGNITGVTNTIKAAAETAFQYGPFSLEGEYMMVKVSGNPGTEPTFMGYHVQASFILTGEKRGYKNGVFSGVKPKNSYGAIELATRWSSIDLIDTGAGIDGGKQNNLTVGLNYYANNNVRFMANYIMSRVEDGAGNKDNPHIFVGRAQYNF